MWLSQNSCQDCRVQQDDNLLIVLHFFFIRFGRFRPASQSRRRMIRKSRAIRIAPGAIRVPKMIPKTALKLLLDFCSASVGVG
jgi:hypothetical protein